MRRVLNMEFQIWEVMKKGERNKFNLKNPNTNLVKIMKINMIHLKNNHTVKQYL
jgi:hypothetical protein